MLAQCFAAGVGASIRVSLGGKADASLGGAPIEAEATVRTLTDGRWDARVGSVGWSPGSRRSLGPMARLVIGGVDVLVCGRRSQVFDAGGFTLAGLDINAYKICAVKSSTHFRAGWAPVSRAILTADEPGWTSNDLAVFEPRRTKRVVRWPLDARAVYPPIAAAAAAAAAAARL